MRVIQELSRLGFIFWLDGTAIRYFHDGERPDPDEVRPMLDYLRRHREEAVLFLREIESRAEALFSVEDAMGSLDWCTQWAGIMTELGARCTGFDSWEDWLGDLERHLASVDRLGIVASSSRSPILGRVKATQV